MDASADAGTATAPTAARGGIGRWRGVIVALLIVVWVAIAGVGGQYQGRLSEVQENDSALFLPTGAESVLAADAVAQFSEDASLPVLLVVRPTAGGAITAEQLAAAEQAGEIAAAAPMSDGTPVSDLLTAPPVTVPSEDVEAGMVILGIDTELTDRPLSDGSGAVGAVVSAVRAAVADDLSAAGLEGWVTGPGGIVADLTAAFGSIDLVLLLVALAVVLVILLLVYRSPSLPFTVLLTAVFALTLAGLVIYHLADAGVIQLNGQSQGIMSILVIGAATDYSLLLVARYREELRRHEDPFRAMRVAWRASLPPIAASAGTVALGLLCLLLSDLGSNSSLGPIAAIGIAAAFLSALTLLPAFLLVGGRRSRGIFWPRVPRYGEHTDVASEDAPGLWGRISRLVGRRDRAVWIVTALALLGASAFIVTLRAEGTSQTDVFLDTTESVDGEAVLAEHFDAGSVQPMDVIATADRLEQVLEAVEAVDGVASVTAVTDAGGEGQAGPPPGVGGDGDSGGDGSAGGEGTGGAPTEGEGTGGAPTEGEGAEGAPTEGEGAEGAPTEGEEAGGSGPPPGVGGDGGDGEPRVVDGRVHLQVTTRASADSEEAIDTVLAVRSALQDVDPDALVGGEAAETLDTRTTAERDLTVIIPAVLVVILLTLIVLLRSILAPVLLLAANVLSFATAMGVVAVVFNHVLDLPGADPTVPLYGFVFLVALGIDYTIFLMTRAREEARTLGTRRGVRRALSVTGGVITSAGVVLAATFAALAVVPLLFLLQVAVIVALGVLIDTLVVRTLLVPALVHDIGRAVWWPAHRSYPPDEEGRGEVTPAPETRAARGDRDGLVPDGDRDGQGPDGDRDGQVPDGDRDGQVPDGGRGPTGSGEPAGTVGRGENSAGA